MEQGSKGQPTEANQTDAGPRPMKEDELKSVLSEVEKLRQYGIEPDGFNLAMPFARSIFSAPEECK